MPTINLIIYENASKVHSAVGKINNFMVTPENYDFGDPLGHGETLEAGIADFKESWMLKRDEEVEVKIVERKIV